MLNKLSTTIFWAFLIALPLIFASALWWLLVPVGIGVSGLVVLALVASFRWGRQFFFKGWEIWQFINSLAIATLLAIVAWIGFCFYIVYS